MRQLWFFILLFCCIGSFGQKQPVAVTSKQLPKTIAYTGRVTHAVKWTDNTGLHYVLTTQTGEIPSKIEGDEDARDAALYAYHYLVNGDSARLHWKVYDYVDGCGLDLLLHFIDKAFAVTDLDKNGTPEVWVMYKKSCQGDVSPVPAKIIMYEGTKKYALRGDMRVQVSAKKFAGGNYTLDDNLRKSNPLFRQYAARLWEKYKTETWQR